MRRELLVHRVPGHHRVEVRLTPVLLRAHDSPQTLRLLLTGSKSARHLHRHARPRQVDTEVCHLGDHEDHDLTGAEGVIKALTLTHRRRPRDNRGTQVLRQLLQLVHVGADHQRGLTRVARQDPVHHCDLPGCRGRQAIALVIVRRRVGHTLTGAQGQAHLRAHRRGDPPLVLQVLPGGVVALGADQREDLVLAPVLTHQGRRQAQTAARLEVGGHTEDRGREQVDLVVDNQPPVVGLQQVQVRVDALAPGGQHLVGGDRHRSDLLAGPRVLPDLVPGEGGEAGQLLLPLPGRDRVGHQDEGRRRGARHGRRPHQGLPGPTGQDHDAGAPRPEALHRLPLVGAQREGPRLTRRHAVRRVPQGDGVGLAVHVASQVLRGPAQLNEHLLEVAALRGVHHDVGLTQGRPQQARGAPRAHDLLEDRHVAGMQDQPVRRVRDQGQAPVAVHGLGDLGEQGVRHREARVGDKGVDHRLGVQSRGARVPQGQGGDPVGVHVLGCPLQLGEGGDGAAGVGGGGVGDLQQDRLVALDNERAVRGCLGGRGGCGVRTGHGRSMAPGGAQGQGSVPASGGSVVSWKEWVAIWMTVYCG